MTNTYRNHFSRSYENLSSLRIHRGKTGVFPGKRLYSLLKVQEVLPSVSFIYFLCSAFALYWHPSRAADIRNVKIRGLWRQKHRRFWTTRVNRKWGLFPLNMPWRHQICIAKCLLSYRDDLRKNLFKITAEECKKSTSGWRSSLKTSLLTARFSETCKLWSSKAAFTTAFFAAVNHNYDHKQRTLKHRNTQNGSKSSNRKSETMTFWTC